MNSGFSFDGEQIKVTKDLEKIARFLISIDHEIETVRNMRKRMISIASQVSDWLGFVVEVKKNHPNFQYSFTEAPHNIIQKLHFDKPIRAECILLFSYLEVMRCLWTAYEKETDNPKDLKDASDNTMDIFIQRFCLAKENKWVRKNSKRAGKLCASKIRDLRNSLVHFFSLPNNGFSLSQNFGQEEEKLMKQTNSKVQFLSPDDLHEMLQGAAEILFLEWDNAHKNGEFPQKIQYVKNVVERDGALFFTKNS